jgi:EmrB/QacA subfamily drug resistance transporter
MSEASLARRYPYLVLTLISFGVLVAAHDLTVISTLLPQIIRDFQIPLPAGLDDASWLVSAYLIAYIAPMPVMGRVSDVYGRLQVYLASLGVFVLGSIGASFAQALPLLIACRAVQALGGGAMVPVGMAIIGDLFEEKRRPLAMGALVAVDTAGWIVGPLYGALLVRFLSWRWQFYINIPLGILAALPAWLVIRSLPQVRQRKALDIPGALLLVAGLVALSIALTYSGGQAASGPSFDFNAPSPTTQLVLPLLGAALLLFAAFILVEWRSKVPTVDLRMFRLPNFATACAVNFLVGSALMIAMVDVPLFINSVLPTGGTVEEATRAAALASGLVLAALTGTMALASLLGGWLCSKLGYRIPTVLGLLASAGGFGLMGTWTPAVPLGAMAPHLALAGLGFGLVTAPLSTAVVDTVDEVHRGVASSLVVVLRLIGMSVGLSVLTAWGLNRFAQLSGEYSSDPLGLTARVLGETFWVSGAVLLVTVVLALFLRRRPGSAPQSASGAPLRPGR